MMKVAMMNNYDVEHIGIAFFIHDYLNNKKRKSETTYKAYLSDIKMFIKKEFGYDKISQISISDIEDLNIFRLKGHFNDLYELRDENQIPVYSNGTINRRMLVVMNLIKHLAAHKVIKYDTQIFTLIEGLPKDSEEGDMIPYNTAIQYAEFFLDEKFNGLEKHFFVKLALDTGFRSEELLSLTWSQFYIDGEYVMIKSSGKTKGKGNKEYLRKIRIEFFVDLLDLKKIGCDKVFGKLKYRTLIDMMNRASENFNDYDTTYTPHSLRRTAITMFYKKTRCIMSTKEFARHESFETLNRYLRFETYNLSGVVSDSYEEDLFIHNEATESQLKKVLEDLPLDVKILVNNKLKNM